MKNLNFILGIFLLSTPVLTAQRRPDSNINTDKKTANSPVALNASPAQEDTKAVALGVIPKKWENESAVILDQKLTFAYYNRESFMWNNESNMVTETIYRKVKLLDKAAVNDFSEFYFYESRREERAREKNSKNGIDESKTQIAVIKPTGERIKVNISDAVEVDNDVPHFYRSYYVGDKTYKKIAIPNLNVGDILEYQLSIDYSVTIDRYNTYHAFPPFYQTLSNKYAVAKQEFNFMLEEGFYLNLNTYNGAPEFQRLDYGYDSKGKKTDKMRTFQIVDSDRDKLPDEMMSLPRIEYPSVKLQVVARRTQSAATEGSIFISEQPNRGKKTVEPEEVAARFNQDYRTAYHAISIGQISRWYKNNNLESKPQTERVKAIYGYVKNQYLEVITPFGASDNIENYQKILSPIKDFYFAVYMSKCLDECDIPNEVIAVMPRNTGKIKDLLLGAEVTWIVKVDGTAGKDIYLYPMHGLQTSDVNRESYLYGGEGYAFIPSIKRKAVKNATARKVTISAPDPSVHFFKTKSVANFDESLEKVQYQRTVETGGILKDNYIPYTTLGFDFDHEYEKRYNVNYDEEKYQKEKRKEEEKKRKKKNKEDDVAEQTLKNMTDKRKELMEMELKNDYEEVDTYDSFELINAGICEDKPILNFKETFKLKNMLSKAGRNYTLEIGKLLGKQPQLDDNDLKPRQSEIQINYPKTLEDELELTLPDGYTIEDLKDLNMAIDNDMMSYKVDSKLVGNKLMVKTLKVYKKITAPKTEWQKVVDVFTAAYNFSQKKVVLKRK